MKPKTLLGAGLLLFAGGSVVYMLVAGGRVAPDEPIMAPYAVLYCYFGARCDTCEKLERYAEEAIREGFGRELEAGTLAWATRDTDQPENTHYLEDLGLYTKSVVLVAYEDGQPARHENLPRIWDLVGDEAAYKAYVTACTRAFLESGHE